MTDKTKQEPVQTAQKTSIDYSDFWDRSWKEEDAESLSNWLEKWQNSTNFDDKKYPTNREQKETTLLAKWLSDKESVCQCRRHTRVGF